MNFRLKIRPTVAWIGVAACIANAGALAQDNANTTLELRSIALKNGESVELHNFWYIANCKSILVGAPQIEILEGPPEITLSVKEGQVVPRSRGCTKPVPGGTVIATAKDIKETKISRLIYRIKYQTKDGDRQTARTYSVGLVP
jgi:hypothetical protein